MLWGFTPPSHSNNETPDNHTPNNHTADNHTTREYTKDRPYGPTPPTRPA
ncbi:hypothetical protein SAMN05660971_01559 [Halomonas cupida]|uniref:Uncharacterized protein n=1 Tax=Halomonas cupida TaxID=44933 RepID=A0A1M7E036_9GAMM|nr:hypothetical protein SAMN05660971_01559 [Halomonas cupida]